MANDDEIRFLKGLDALSYTDIIDTLSLPGSRVLFFSEKGIAVENPSSTIMAASFCIDCSWISPLLGDNLIAAHGEPLYSYLSGKGYKVEEPCFLYVYEGKPFHADYCDIMPLGEEYAAEAAENYHSALDYIKERIRSNRIWGIFPDGRFAGFAGFHTEGAMGMLEILPGFRRRSLGERLEMFLIDKAMEEGRAAYCNVYVSNKPSEALQQKLGLIRSDMLTWWMRRDD